MIRRLIIFAVALFTFSSCFKETSYSTEYILRPLVQAASGGDYTPLEGVRAYAFEADSAYWHPRSYDEALAGVATNAAGEKMQPIAASLPHGDSRNEVSMLVEAQNVLIVAVDTENLCYAYTNYEVAENLPETYVSVVFRAWKNDKVYKDGTWFFYPTYIEPEPEPEVEEPTE